MPLRGDSRHRCDFDYKKNRLYFALLIPEISAAQVFILD
jgi:hypothetical protein